ncbi:hypothetical protein SLS56_009228 [Neofusicoccum ribis]|uniref:Uncharacterized protein n=1 Tax=Neofusicoccum ribis TaxID=45134 RepID=A0ABR3SJD0_9PEZI
MNFSGPDFAVLFGIVIVKEWGKLPSISRKFTNEIEAHNSSSDLNSRVYASLALHELGKRVDEMEGKLEMSSLSTEVFETLEQNSTNTTQCTAPARQEMEAPTTSVPEYSSISQVQQALLDVGKREWFEGKPVFARYSNIPHLPLEETRLIVFIDSTTTCSRSSVEGIEDSDLGN